MIVLMIGEYCDRGECVVGLSDMLLRNACGATYLYTTTNSLQLSWLLFTMR
jgi:hypothetical protein